MVTFKEAVQHICIDICEEVLQEVGKGEKYHVPGTLQGEATMRKGEEIRTEWKTFLQFMAKQPKQDMKLQMRELTTNDMLIAMFPNLSRLAVISLSIPVTTASVERSFSKMKLIQSCLRSCH